MSSTSLRGRTPLVHGFIPTRNSSSAPLGSHSLSLSRDEPQGFGDWSATGAFVASLLVAILFLLQVRFDHRERLWVVVDGYRKFYLVNSRCSFRSSVPGEVMVLYRCDWVNQARATMILPLTTWTL